ncbi:hypothetical protein PAHAL_9G616000 [Panicum hallii]|uniref:Uncharacterized protein n=1 Tax=Panicum hallii TaxID=206008 RepID=A0A2S3IV92_9POAL|nr:hypothetical protein PAHAL_9G616000 [Panicum hallii]PAN52029.1 hypothetical protein PAHAL_9G616000 [Panicum hallii]
MKKNPTIIHIDRKVIFHAVAEKLGLYIKKEAVIQIGPSYYIGKLEVAGPYINEAEQLDSKEFYSALTTTADEAIQSVYNEVLKYVDVNKLIAIDGYNYQELQKTKSVLFSSETYLMFSEESEDLMESQLNFKIEGYNSSQHSMLPVKKPPQCYQYQQVIAKESGMIKSNSKLLTMVRFHHQLH